ncbi:DUF2569 domain-containing protein [Sphingobium estronivorans]|uniref:DUF2569 domain-containing protein n=1 Tax=Sphingobium estronivorans TaxID=1577690 RepID=UPI0012388E7F|nr:DUF2569 domain-containing protein [Sphingobium estronivorans]
MREQGRPFAVAFLLSLTRAYTARLHRTSRSLVTFLDLRMETLITGWIAVILLIGGAKVLTAPMPINGVMQGLSMLLPYLLVALAPIAGYRIAAGSFPRGQLSAQPVIRLCRYGQWRALDELSARRSPAFGPTGFMASLLLGLLLNVPVRSLEFFAAVPAMGGDAPLWAQKILLAMTMDVIVMNFFYMVCFVLALRSVPLFPRMLLLAWVFDIVMQFIMAQQIAGASHLPAQVATAMTAMLTGNVKKVLISAALWLPYLILSERVNVTFRRRARTI